MAVKQAVGLRFQGGEYVQAVKPGVTEVIAAGAASQQTAGALNAQGVLVCADTWVHMKRGTPGVTATSSDQLIPPGVIMGFVINTTDAIAFVKKAGSPDGLVSVTKFTEL